jgi:signal transduction histidine kinase
VLALVSALSTVIAVRQRFRRATGEERQQMRWLAFVASLSGSFFALLWIVGLAGEVLPVSEDAPIFGILLALTAFTIVLGIPTAYLVAIFRHGLWDIDVVIRKTVLYATVALLLVALFLVFAVGVGRALIEAEPGAIVASIVMGLLFWPAVRVARRVADRLVYGRRATPYEVLTDFSHRLGGSYASEDVLPRMAAILGEAVGASRAIVWLRVGREWRAVGVAPGEAEAPEPVGALGDRMPALPADAAVEVRDQGDLLGALTVSMPPNDPMSPSKERLIRDLASQAGLVLRNVRLIEELRASRQRLVAAQDEERRRLERNIHDGAQQQLVALTVKLRLLEQLAGRDPAKAADMAAQLQADTTETLEDLRDLARGIYPPLLADQGLTAALEAQARKSTLPVTVEATDLGRLSQDVEAAIYFSCLEALQNVAKYADASRATISLTRSNGRLSFAVSDDGVGFDPDASSYGTGLQGIADRLDALGGRFEIRSAPGEGTTLVGLVPSPKGEIG